MSTNNNILALKAKLTPKLGLDDDRLNRSAKE